MTKNRKKGSITIVVLAAFILSFAGPGITSDSKITFGATSTVYANPGVESRRGDHNHNNNRNNNRRNNRHNHDRDTGKIIRDIIIYEIVKELLD